MKVQYKLKSCSIVYNINNVRAAYSVHNAIKIFFSDGDGNAHNTIVNKNDLEYFFVDREKHDKYITPNGADITFKDLINAASRCRYDVKKCANCPFYSADNANCYIDFMNAIIYLCGGNLIDG